MSLVVNCSPLLHLPLPSTRVRYHSIPTSLLHFPSNYSQWLKSKQEARLFSHGAAKRNGVKAFFFNPEQDPIVKEALKEPVAFLGGMFAGILRLDLNEEPLKEWVTKTVEAAGISNEEVNPEESTTEEAPQEIQIE